MFLLSFLTRFLLLFVSNSLFRVSGVIYLNCRPLPSPILVMVVFGHSFSTVAGKQCVREFCYAGSAIFLVMIPVLVYPFNTVIRQEK